MPIYSREVEGLIELQRLERNATVKDAEFQKKKLDIIKRYGIEDKCIRILLDKKGLLERGVMELQASIAKTEEEIAAVRALKEV